MAGKTPQRPDPEQPEAIVDNDIDDGADTGTSALADDTIPARSEADVVADGGSDSQPDGDPAAAMDRSLWTSVNVAPVEIALPSGVGYTLRAYRLSTALTPTDVEGREEDEDPFAARVAVIEDEDDEEVVVLDEEFLSMAAEERGADTEPGTEDEDTDKGKQAGGDGKASAAEADDDEDEPEEVPFFLSHRGKLLLFKTPESLVSFIRSGAPHDLAELDTWSDLAERIEPQDVTADAEDSYELDLVVENLRGGHDTWDLQLLVRAGEIARDLGYALRLPAVLTALSPGSPLDDLDDALRAAAKGGVSGFMGRRRLRRIGAQQASLGWRTIIGKISAAVDWRD